MTTLAAPPSARPQAAGASPLLTQADLEDPEKFVTVRRVPILDAHDDPEYGPVDEALLHRMARNCNRMVARGDFPALQIGHTRPWKDAVVVDRKSGEATLRPATPEKHQSEIVGHASGFHVAPFRGVPTLHADFHFHAGDAAYARTYPYRSVERPPNPDADPAADLVDRISLQRTPPRRDLGALHYSPSAAAQAARICYARDLPPITAAEDDEPEGAPAEDATASAAAPESAAPAPAEPPANPDPSPTPEESPAMALTPEEIQALTGAMVQAFRAVLHEEAEASADEHEPAPPPEDDDNGAEYAEDYPDEADVSPEEEDAETTGRAMYDAGEIGGGAGAMPNGGAPCAANRGFRAPQAPSRREYSRQGGRREYSQDLGRRCAEMERDLVYLYDRAAEQEQFVAEAQFEKRRMNYERQLLDLHQTEGREFDLAEELEELTPDSPADFEAKRTDLIRRRYARSPIVNPGRVPAARPSAPGGAGALDAALRSRAVAIAQQKGCSFNEALAIARGA